MSKIPETRDTIDPWSMTGEQIQKAIDMESALWDKAGMKTEMVIFNIFQMNAMIWGIGKLLEAKGIATNEEFLLKVNQQMLANLIETRKVHEAEVRRAQIMHGVQTAGPLVPPNLLGPDGRSAL